MVRFEVRMTAFNRPMMLRRALESIRAQTYSRWMAVVYDDSSSADSENVVSALADPRIVYRRNPQRLGAVLNVDQCFSPAPISGGHYGCLLEDDNYWLPGFLSSIAEQLQKKPWPLLQVNQRFAIEGEGLQPDAETTRGKWFPSGTVGPLDLRATLFFMEGVSNGGLVWKLDDADLRIGASVLEATLNEYCRSLVVSTPFLFLENPLAVYTVLPHEKSARATVRNRTVSRGVQSIRDNLLSRHGEAVLGIARRLAARVGQGDHLGEALAYNGHPLLAASAGGGGYFRLARALAKGTVLRLVERDPCAAFLQSNRIAEI